MTREEVHNRSITMKEMVLQAIERLPDDAIIEDVRACIARMSRDRFARLVREGLADAKAGRVIPDEQLDAFFDGDDEGFASR